MTPRVSVVIPVYNEGEGIVRHLERILREVLLPAEILVVHDMPEDTTVPYARQLARHDPRVRTVLNTYGPGPANAIRFGINAARAPVAVVTMADGCDDPRQIDDLARLVDRGVVVAAASRYMPGGQQVGGPRFKRMASRWAGRSLRLFARVGTRDATNSFKAYDTAFVREVGIESRTGFEIGIELTAKATRLRRPVAEIPTIWLDRQLGETRFDVGRFLPSYLRWYFFAFGRRLTATELAARWAERRPDAALADRDKEGTPA
jgi:dolichol-phosphate mannosyltransferase